MLGFFDDFGSFTDERIASLRSAVALVDARWVEVGDLVEGEVRGEEVVAELAENGIATDVHVGELPAAESEVLDRGADCRDRGGMTFEAEDGLKLFEEKVRDVEKGDDDDSVGSGIETAEPSRFEGSPLRRQCRAASPAPCRTYPTTIGRFDKFNDRLVSSNKIA
jgi:hypothetical protein